MADALCERACGAFLYRNLTQCARAARRMNAELLVRWLPQEELCQHLLHLASRVSCTCLRRHRYYSRCRSASTLMRRTLILPGAWKSHKRSFVGQSMQQCYGTEISVPWKKRGVALLFFLLTTDLRGTILVERESNRPLEDAGVLSVPLGAGFEKEESTRWCCLL